MTANRNFIRFAHSYQNTFLNIAYLLEICAHLKKREGGVALRVGPRKGPKIEIKICALHLEKFPVEFGPNG